MFDDEYTWQKNMEFMDELTKETKKEGIIKVSELIELLKAINEIYLAGLEEGRRQGRLEVRTEQHFDTKGD